MQPTYPATPADLRSSCLTKSRGETVTLVYAARNQDHNSALVLKNDLISMK
jgi:uncharacterized protein YeaO (DUF488 family)